MSGPRRVTMRDIAQRLDVDQSTISLALRNHPRISEEMRKKVARMAEEMGYQPDAMLSALAHYRRAKVDKPVTAELAWINRWQVPSGLRLFREFEAYWRGAYETARNNGYALEAFDVEPTQSLEQLNKVLKARNIQGILLPPIRGTVNWNGLEWERYAVVRFGYSIPDLPVNSVVIDQLGAGLMAFEKAYGKGYRRIGYITSWQQALASRFAAGFLFGQARCPEAVPIPILSIPERAQEADSKRLLAWMKKNKPDAIFTNVPNLRSLLEGLSFQVPQDVGLMTTTVLDSDCDTGVDQNSNELGKIAVENLISLINHDHRGIPQVSRMNSVQVNWVEGSCLPPRS